MINDAIDRYAEKVCNDFNVPGLAVAIVKDGRVVMAKGYGVRALGSDQPATEESLFGIASISKSFTAMALGMLVDEGKLCWDDPVTKHIPSFQLYDAYATREFTVLDLLVHRSGLAPVSGGAVWYGSDYSRDDVIHRIRHLRPVSSFRSQYAYQNITYLVAGQIIPALTGQTWDDFVAERIFTPLEMHTSNTSITAFGAESNVFQPHVEVDGRLQVVALRNHDNVGPAASINTSVRELTAYVRLLLNGGQYKGQQLYSADIARDLWTPRTLIPLLDEFPEELSAYMPQFYQAYALGWRVQDYHGQRMVAHSGGVDGLRSLVTMIPGEHLGVIVFANAEVPAPWVMTNLILDLHRGGIDLDRYDAARTWWKQEKEKRTPKPDIAPVPNTTPSLGLEAYAGRYHSDLYGDIKVAHENARLKLTFLHTKSFNAELTHWHYDTFRIVWQDPVIPDGLLTFILDAQGNVAEMRLDQPNLLDVDFSELHPIRRVVEESA